MVAILKGGQDTTRARKSPENKCEGFLHGSLSRVGKITLPIHPDNPHLTTTTRHVMVGITRSKVICLAVPKKNILTPPTDGMVVYNYTMCVCFYLFDGSYGLSQRRCSQWILSTMSGHVSLHLVVSNDVKRMGSIWYTSSNIPGAYA